MPKKKWETIEYRPSRVISDEIADFLESKYLEYHNSLRKLLDLHEELVNSLNFEERIERQKSGTQRIR